MSLKEEMAKASEDIQPSAEVSSLPPIQGDPSLSSSEATVSPLQERGAVKFTPSSNPSITGDVRLKTPPPPSSLETSGLFHFRESQENSVSNPADPSRTSDPHSRDLSVSVSINSISESKPPSEDSLLYKIQHFEDASEVDLPTEEFRRPRMTGIGSILDNKYRITHKIAEGGMGVVFGASHVKLGKQVAIKVISPGTLRNEESRRRFIREAKASTMLSSPHTVRVYDYNVSQWGEPYLVMEFVSGANLYQVIKKEGAFDADRSVEILKQIAQSLMEAHALGLVHRDLKPSNLMLMQLKGHDEFVKIFDFGVVKFTDAPEEADLTRQGAVLGTPRYMAPEQITSPGDVSFPADIFSLGLILFYMLTAEKPFGEDDQDLIRLHRLNGKTVTLPKGLEIPPSLRTLFNQMTQVDPKRRPTAEELFSHLKNIENEIKAGTYSGSHSFNYNRSLGGGGGGRSFGKIAAFLSLPLLLGAAWLFWPRPSTSPNPRLAAQTTPQVSPRPAPPPREQETKAKPSEPPPRHALPSEPSKTLAAQGTAPNSRTEEPSRLPPPSAVPTEVPSATPPRRRPPPRRTRAFPPKRSRSFTISSSPSGAKVYNAQKEYLGTTPFSLKVPPNQPLSLLFKKDGYFGYRLSISAQTQEKAFRARLREINIETP